MTEAKKYLRDLLVATYQGHADALIERLKEVATPTLLWLCWIGSGAGTQVESLSSNGKPSRRL